VRNSCGWEADSSRRWCCYRGDGLRLSCSSPHRAKSAVPPTTHAFHRHSECAPSPPPSAMPPRPIDLNPPSPLVAPPTRQAIRIGTDNNVPSRWSRLCCSNCRHLHLLRHHDVAGPVHQGLYSRGCTHETSAVAGMLRISILTLYPADSASARFCCHARAPAKSGVHRSDLGVWGG